MTRYISERDVTPILDAAQNWATKCFVGDGSLFSGESLWRAELIGELVARFVDNPVLGNESFLERLQKQLLEAPPQSITPLALMAAVDPWQNIGA